MVRPRLALLVLASVLACGDEPGSPLDAGPNQGGPDASTDPGGESPRTDPLPVSDEGPLLLGHSAARDVIASGERALAFGLDGIAFASSHTGRLTTVGRVEVPAPGAQPRFIEDAGPGLTVSFFDEQGGPVEVWIDATRIEGSGSTGSEFLGGDHAVTARVRIEGQLDLTIASTRSGRDVQGSVEGSALVEPATVDVDIAFTGERWGEVDLSGSSGTTRLHTTGRLEGPSFTASIDERFDAEIVTAEGEAAMSSTSHIASSVDANGRVYRFVGVRVRRAFRDGRPSDLDGFWSAEGEVTRDEAVAATYRYRQDGQGFVLVELVTPRGSLELERWRIR